MRVALAGPVQVERLRPWLDAGEGEGAGAGKALRAGGSGGTPVTLLARALLAGGAQLAVVGLDPTIEEERVLTGPRLRLHLLPRRPHHRGRDAYAVERARLRRALRASGADVIHAHWTYEYALAALATGIPALVTLHDWAPTILRLSPDPYRAVRLGMAARTLTRARHLTVPSPYLGELLRRWTGRQARVVPNALEDEAFAAPAPRAGPPQLLAINDGFSRRKNTATLLSAFALLRRSHPEARLTLVGDDHEVGGGAHGWAGRNGLTDAVTFAGPVPALRVRELLAQASVLVHPSLEEAFGLVVVEAMAQGLPVVAGRHSGAVPWVLGDGTAGVLTDVRVPATLAAAVAGLLDDDTRAEATARAGHAHAWTHFRLAAVLPDWLETYAAVLAGRRR